MDMFDIMMAAKRAGKKVNANIAPDYASLTFPVAAGTLCFHEGKLYEANTTISTSEDWTAAHWTEITLMLVLGDLKSDVAGKLNAPTTPGTAAQVLVSDGDGGQVWGDIEAGEVVVDPTLSVSGAAADAAACGELKTAIDNSRVTSLDATNLASGAIIEAVGIPVFVDDVTDYAAYGLTDTGWYLFVRIAAKGSVVVSAQTTVSGAAGYIATVGAAYVDAAVKFGVASVSQPVTITWSTGNADTFVFKATDLAVRNLDYRTTFYVYDISDFTTWSYALTTDETFVEGKNYYTESGGVYTLAEVTPGDAVPENTYYVHSGVAFAGMTRNITYKLDAMVDCPITFVLPEIPDDGYGAWFEVQIQCDGSYSITLDLQDADAKVASNTFVSLSAGVFVLDLQYTSVNGVKIWRALRTQSTIPTPAATT